MKLEKMLSYFKNLIIETGEGVFLDNEIRDMTVDSRKVSDKSAFFAVRGAQLDGHDYIKDALKKGASIVFGEKSLDLEKYIKLSNVEKALFLVSESFYGHPQKEMSSTAITGTNGKTTVAHIIQKMLSRKMKTGLVSTTCCRTGDREFDIPNTTPFIWDWYRILAEMRDNSVKHFVSEVSSHALEQERVKGSFFNTAVFTGFSRDHMDFHGSMDAYFNSKKKLFENYMIPGGRAVINADDKKAGKIAEAAEKGGAEIRFFSMIDPDAHLFVEKYSVTENKTLQVKMKYNFEIYDFTLPMVGVFNLRNAMAAILAVSGYMPIYEALAVLEEGVSITGRMERVVPNFNVFVDYAHTPDALNNVLESLEEFKTGGRIITVFGAGGDRDKGKRSEMGAVVEKHSDLYIITNDNPRTENPFKIIDDIVSGTDEKKVVVIPDRKKAIRKAVDWMSENDIVLIAGKGHEEYQINGTVKSYFSDREEALDALKAREIQ